MRVLQASSSSIQFQTSVSCILAPLDDHQMVCGKKRISGKGKISPFKFQGPLPSFFLRANRRTPPRRKVVLFKSADREREPTYEF